jgi:hypothetical protein
MRKSAKSRACSGRHASWTSAAPATMTARRTRRRAAEHQRRVLSMTPWPSVSVARALRAAGVKEAKIKVNFESAVEAYAAEIRIQSQTSLPVTSLSVPWLAARTRVLDRRAVPVVMSVISRLLR